MNLKSCREPSFDAAAKLISDGVGGMFVVDEWVEEDGSSA